MRWNRIEDWHITLAFLGEFSTAHVHLERAMTLYDPEQHRASASLYGQDQGVVC